MAVGMIEISTERLQDDIDRMTECEGRARRQTQKMFAAMKELDSMWDGPANEAFRRQFEADYRTMLGLCDEVRALIECMEFAKKEYDQCEAAVYAAVAALNIEGGV